LLKKEVLGADSFFDCFVLFGREYFFFACGASEGFHVVKGDAVNFKVKLDFDVFNAACRTKQSVCPNALGFIG